MFTYFSTEFANNVHDTVIKKSGGLNGVKDIGQLNSVLTHIQNDFYYPTFNDKLTHLVFSVVQFHMFIDGNKRTALLLGSYFMDLNHYSYCVDTFITVMENVIIDVASSSISKEDLNTVITAIINDELPKLDNFINDDNEFITTQEFYKLLNINLY